MKTYEGVIAALFVLSVYGLSNFWEDGPNPIVMAMIVSGLVWGMVWVLIVTILDGDVEEELAALRAEEAEARMIQKLVEDNRGILMSPAFQEVINDKFGGVINAETIRAAGTPELMQAILAEQTAEYEARMAMAESAWDEYEKAHAEMEANPGDPYAWIRLAKAFEAGNHPSEAEACRRTAMNLMEK